MPFKDPETRRDYAREYARRRRAEDPAFRARTDEVWKTYRLQTVRRAAEAVRYAIRKGKLVRPGQCEQCGVACFPDAAHHDYNARLDVRWLCRSCHTVYDRESKTLPFRGEKPLVPNRDKTHCPQGHPYQGDNLQLVRTPSGGLGRRCATCHRAETRARSARTGA